MDDSVLKIPPHSIEAEQSVIGGIMMDNNALDKVGDFLQVDDFYRRDHRLIYATICELAGKNIPLDVVTVADHLSAQGLLDESGGLAYIGTIAKNTPSSHNIVAYANIVVERSRRRQIIHAGMEAAEAAYNEPDIEIVMNTAQGSMMAIGDRLINVGDRHVKEGVSKALNQLEERFQAKKIITGIPTGFIDIDKRTSGLQPTDLIIVAGRPSMGKTTYAMNIAEHAATNGHVVQIFSLEMSEEQISQRSMASLGRLPFENIRTGQMEEEDWIKTTSAVGLLFNSGLFICDIPALSYSAIRTIARRRKRTDGLDLIIIDYIQLMKTPKAERHDLAIAEISKNLKALAKELNVPVIALSQLNRSLEQRPNKRPKLSDLRESGAIEQDADIIQFIYRDEVYNEDSPDKGTAEIITAKYRNGQPGTDRLVSTLKYCRFDNFMSY